MSDKKLSQLPLGSALTGPEKFYADNGSDDVSQTAGQISDFVKTQGADLTKADDTNVTLTLGGTATGSLLKAVSITVGWSGTLAAGRLNSNVVQAVSNDTNITGSISSQSLTLGWSGALGAARGGFGADVSAESGVPLFSTGVASFLSTTGAGDVVRATSPTLVTPVLGAATATSINGNTFTTGTYTITGAGGKTLTFSNTLTLAGTDGTTMTFPASSAAMAALNLEDQTVSGGARVTVKDLGIGGSGATFTPDPGDRPMQKLTNGGDFTLAPGTNVGAYLLTVTNVSGAGTVTTSGWTQVSGSFDTTPGNKFRCHCSIDDDGDSLLVIQALQ